MKVVGVRCLTSFCTKPRAMLLPTNRRFWSRFKALCAQLKENDFVTEWVLPLILKRLNLSLRIARLKRSLTTEKKILMPLVFLSQKTQTGLAVAPADAPLFLSQRMKDLGGRWAITQNPRRHLVFPCLRFDAKLFRNDKTNESSILTSWITERE
jgi:hypothetical protein